VLARAAYYQTVCHRGVSLSGRREGRSALP
jgi:hypothetical protein